jgi:hypothetical protein
VVKNEIWKSAPGEEINDMDRWKEKGTKQVLFYYRVGINLLFNCIP